MGKSKLITNRVTKIGKSSVICYEDGIHLTDLVESVCVPDAEFSEGVRRCDAELDEICPSECTIVSEITSNCECETLVDSKED